MTAHCTVCDVEVTLAENVEVSEVINCAECGTRLVVEGIEDKIVTLAQAPEVEEDWGE